MKNNYLPNQTTKICLIGNYYTAEKKIGSTFHSNRTENIVSFKIEMEWQQSFMKELVIHLRLRRVESFFSG